MFLRKKPIPPLIPDPGQQVYLLVRDASERRAVRAISEPSTNSRGVVVIWVTVEQEYQDALREGRRAMGIPWPVDQKVVSPSEASQRPSERRKWWRRLFGFA